MKYYETTFDEYIQSAEKHNIHPELNETFTKFPQNVYQLENTIIYGPSGVGKYTQMLLALKKYSPSHMKYDKKITVTTDKQEYIYRISDIHYEIDMALLGCNSKTLWHEIFFQIVDIISVKQDKIGIIVCKNFHQIHSELLDIFYSYMQQYNHSHTNIIVKFCIITEHVSFLPASIINVCHMIKIPRPDAEQYKQIHYARSNHIVEIKPENFVERITHNKIKYDSPPTAVINQLDQISPSNILNMKETRQFDLYPGYSSALPEDIFNIVCDKIIADMYAIDNSSFMELRESLYNILTYNLDATECIWYILSHFVMSDELTDDDMSQILDRMFKFLKYYNNNYRPIYHLESILFYIINKIHNLDE
jgi:hypothetical protein